MPVYLDVLVVLNFLVDYLLLLGTNRLSGYPLGWKRALPAAALGGVYGGACVLPGLTFLAWTPWRVVSLALIAGIAFGFRKESARRGILFLLLSMSLGGVVLGLGGSFWMLVLSAAVVAGLCVFGFRGRAGAQYVPVELEGLRFTALRDTGNSLVDPLTGQQVLVLSSKVGHRLLGLPDGALHDPVEAMEKVHGARLLPYQTVGQKGALLLAKRFDNVRIGTWKGSCLVAFSPIDLGHEALTGGVL